MDSYKATISSADKQDELGRLQTIYNERYIYQIKTTSLAEVAAMVRENNNIELLRMEKTDG
jgi:hypothetical protein